MIKRRIKKYNSSKLPAWNNDTKSHWISLCISSCPIHKRVGIALTITRIGSYLLKSVHINACLSSELITYTGHNCSHTSSLHCGMAFKPFVKGKTLVDPYKQTISIKSSKVKRKAIMWNNGGSHLNFTYNLQTSQREWNACGMNHFISFPFLKPLKHHRNGWNCFLTRACSQLRFKCRQI